jgi:hypothetical protein
MLWRILRPSFWILDRKVRETNRAIIAVVILIVAFGGQWLYSNLVRDSLASLGSEQAMASIASILPLAFFLFLLFALLGVGDVLYLLYLNPDLELLMVAPIPYRTIFFVKLLQCSRATAIPVLGLAALLLAVGLARDAAPDYYLLVLLLLLSAMLLTTALIILLVILLARFLPARKARSWIPVIVVLLTLIMVLGQQAATGWLLEREDLLPFLIEALLEPGQLLLFVTGLGAMALLAGLSAYWAFNVSFHEGWNRFHEVPALKPSTSPHAGRPKRLTTWTGFLPSPLSGFLVKEWLELVRSPRALINLAQPLVLVAVVLVPFLGGGEATATLQPLIFWFMLVYLVVFLATLPVGTTLMTIAREGRNISLLRSVPISMSDVLKGKFWASWLPTALWWAVVLLAAGLLARLPLWQIGFLLSIVIWGSAGAAAATAGMGGLTVDFAAKELKQRVRASMSYLQMALNLAFTLLTIGICLWLMVRAFPESQTVLVLQTLSQYRFVGWLFSASLWIPLALAGAQGAFWIGVVLLWRAAVRRLEQWELAAE